MNRTQKIAVLLVVLLALTVVAAFLLATYQNSLRPNLPHGFRYNVADLELYYTIRAIFTTINIVLTVIIIVSYADIYVKTKSPFTIGLLLFAILFLLKDIMLNPFVIGIFQFTILGLGPFAMIPDMFETAALLVLFYLAVKY